jgi:hypothetical protein
MLELNANSAQVAITRCLSEDAVDMRINNNLVVRAVLEWEVVCGRRIRTLVVVGIVCIREEGNASGLLLM